MQMTLVQNLPCKFHGDSRKDITLEVRGKFQLHALSTFSFSINHKYLWIMCILCTPRPIYRLTSRSTYRPTLDQCISRYAECRPMCRSTYRSSVGRYVDRDVSVNVSTDVSTEISAEWWSTYQPTIGRYLSRYSGRHLADTLTIDCRSTVGGISVKSLDC